MLLFLSALESYGVQGRIAGAYEVSPQGFIYAKIWFKYLMSAQIMFILLQLFHGNMQCVELLIFFYKNKNYQYIYVNIIKAISKLLGIAFLFPPNK